MSLQGKPLSGYVQMTQVQAAYLGSGNAGNGTLRYRGRTYPFMVGGLGVGGIGISKIEAKSEVYGLERLRDFPGAYIQGQYGFALGTTSAGDLWLKNGNWCDHASGREATRADAECGRRRGGDPNEPVRGGTP